MAYIEKISREKPMCEIMAISPIYPNANSDEKVWCFLVKIGEQYVMSGPTGSHSISADTALDINYDGDTRLDIHWHGFLENNTVHFHGEPE
jgi:hypothetical protein